MREKIAHKLNPLRVFCRLKDRGYSKKSSYFIAVVYEYAFYKPFIRWSGLFRIRLSKLY